MCFLVILHLVEVGEVEEKDMTNVRRGFILSRYPIL